MVALKKQASAPAQTLQQKTFKQRFTKAWNRDWQLFLLCLPALLYVAVFCYGPMYGIQIAFKDSVGGKGTAGSE